jgi:quercetin dioxygenase-like cupin family protein
MKPQATRRSGLLERRLLIPERSEHQNLVLVDAEEGAEVELHKVHNSESFFVLRGELLVSGPGFEESLGPGDLCHFHPGMKHAVRIVSGPAQFLVVFAPGRSSGEASPSSGSSGSADE